MGCVSNSGSLSNETYNIIARNTDGLYEGIAIGGDRFPGQRWLTTCCDLKNPAIKMLVALGEVGGNDEYEIVRALQEKKITKPLVIWVTGTCAKAFKTEVQFGHAGAKANIEMETADAKNKALREAGAYVPDSFDDYDKLINKVYTNLVKEGVIIPAPEPEIPKIPVDYDVALKSKMIRRPANFVSSIRTTG